jgi:frataxin-like iron-binding protein CyaY
MREIAFLGSGRNESPGVYIGLNAGSRKISTREIDQILEGYSEIQLSKTVVETRIKGRQQLLYIHLPDQTLVFDGEATLEIEIPVWFRLTSSITGNAKYRGKNFVWSDQKWICGDTQNGSTYYGYLDETTSEHFGQTIGWDFNTAIIYNESKGAIFNKLELVGLPGRVPLGLDPVIFTSYSFDGQTWSQEKMVSVGKIGERDKRMVWFKQGFMRNYRIQRFRGTSDAHLAICRLEADLERLIS